MTWKSFHRRGEVLRDVIAAADARRDGSLPMDVAGVAETFGDEHALLGALTLKWHTRLAGRIEHELMSQPMDLDSAVISAWHETARALPGVLAILDRYRAAPLDAQMADMLEVSAAKQHILLAVMAGHAAVADELAVQVGERIEARARATYRTPVVLPAPEERSSLLDRLRAVLAA